MNSGSFSTSLVLELSVLQEISSLRDSGTVEKLVEEVSEKASRLLGCRRFALILFEGETRRLAGTWGITDLSSIDAIIESGGKNVFIQDFTLDNERRGTVVFEQAKPMDAKQKRLYTLLAGRMKEIIRSIQAREQKQAAEKELSNSKTFFDNILNSVEDGIMVLDEDFSIKYCNRIVQNWLSERINLHSNKCHQLFNSLDAPCEECPAAASLSSGKPERSLIRGIKGSEVEWVEAFASPLLTEAGEFSGTVVSIRDISLQKKLEEDLYQIRKLEAVNTLTTGVAHEFNNILQAVIGYSEFIMSRMEDSDRFYNDIAQIHDFGLSGSALINKIMAFSRKSDVELTTVDLNRRVAHTSDLLQKTIPKMVRIEQVTDSELWPVRADPTQIDQILLNLAGNAVDAMPKGGVLCLATRNATLDSIFCSSHLGMTPGNYVQLRVEDTGIGMDENTRRRVFEPFFTTKTFGKGTGLGLAAVFGTVESLGGRILCESEPGRGTAFTIYLPAFESGEVHYPAAHTVQKPSRGDETVLLVDDEERIRYLAAEMLGSLGYSVLQADSGEKALEIYRVSGNTIDIVVMDMGMPGMGGYQCLDQLMRVNPEARVLIASGYTAENSLVRDSLARGASGFINKPYRLADISGKIREILDSGG